MLTLVSLLYTAIVVDQADVSYRCNVLIELMTFVFGVHTPQTLPV